MNQRLEHIRSGAGTLAQQLKQRSTAVKWTPLADQLPSSYTMEAEHKIYCQIFGIAHEITSSAIEPDNNIELF